MYTQIQAAETNMLSHIAKWGNSLGIRIPRAVAKQLDIADGSEVNLTVENDQIIISKPKYTLQELLAKVNKNNLHGEVNFGKPRGHEEW